MLKMIELADFGQSIWYDYIKRSFLEAGELKQLVDIGLRGVTSNPAIFEKVISSGDEYDDAVRTLFENGKTPNDIYETLAKADVSTAADILKPLYDTTGGKDGFVSLEVNPSLASDTAATVAEGKRLYEEVGRSNLMIKVPATKEGVPAIAELIGSGVNVNVTLIFSIDNYCEVADAYMKGLEKLAADGPTVSSGHTISSIASVASFFVSRIDAAVDKELDKIGNSDLKGTIAIANAKLAYIKFQELVSSDRWQVLASQGASVQRLLWASTSTKDPSYPDTLYVDGLIGRDTVNTVPPSTLDAFLDHGNISETLTTGVEHARRQLAELNKLNIDIDEITRKLQDDAVTAFFEAMNSLVSSVTAKCDVLEVKR